MFKKDTSEMEMQNEEERVEGAAENRRKEKQSLVWINFIFLGKFMKKILTFIFFEIIVLELN